MQCPHLKHPRLLDEHAVAPLHHDHAAPHGVSVLEAAAARPHVVGHHYFARHRVGGQVLAELCRPRLQLILPPRGLEGDLLGRRVGAEERT